LKKIKTSNSLNKASSGLEFEVKSISITPIKIVIPLAKFTTNWKVLRRFALQNIT